MYSKKTIVLFLFIIKLTTIDAQVHKKNIKKKKIEEPLFFLCSNFVIQKNDLNIHKDFLWKTFYGDEKFHRGMQSFGSNLGVGFKINNRFDILSSISYQKYKIYESGYIGYYCDLNLYNATKIDTAYRKIFLSSINIPIECRYKIQSKYKLTLLSSLGISFNAFVEKKQDVVMLLDNGVYATHYANKHILPIMNKFTISPFVKLGSRIQVNKMLHLKAEAFYNYNLMRENIITQTKDSNLFTYGLSLGIEYKLK
jgi:hypothetical protein